MQQSNAVSGSRTSQRASGRSSSRAASSHTPAVESAVTRLLVAIKQLLEALTLWSTLKMDEDEVSDVYVRLGNDFNSAVAAFGAYGIDMSELLSVPDDLRTVLEQCLGEDANPANLDQYLPTVRQIITNLLQGLRTKQSLYRRSVADREPGHQRTSSRSSRATQEAVVDRTSSVESRASRVGSNRRVLSSSSHSQQGSDNDGRFIGGFAAVVEEGDAQQQIPRRSSANSQGLSPDPHTTRTPRQSQRTLSDEQPQAPPPAPSAQPTVPPGVKRFSLSDNPVPQSPRPFPEVVVEASSPKIGRDASESPLGSPPIPAIDGVQNSLAAQSSLAALKHSEALERRASKRFSTYTFSKMTGMGRDKSGGRMAVGGSLTPGDLAALVEGDEDGDASKSAPRKTSTRRSNSARRTKVAPPTVNEDDETDTPPVPQLPPPSPSPSPMPPSVSPEEEAPEAGPSTSNGPITVFLQVGRQVKKVTIDPGLSFASLRVLFMDRFSYNPGQDNFPEIYIRDPSSGVQYELEDVTEVKNKCLLCLNIEPLDQIKQHIDIQIANLSQDLKDLKSSLGTARRVSLPPAVVPPPLPTSAVISAVSSAPSRPSDEQIHKFARRMSRMVEASSTAQSQPLMPQHTGSTLSDAQSSRIVNDLRTHFDEVGNLRRDLGVLRQLYTDFMSATKDSLGTLRTQAATVKQLADNKVGGARAYIDSGKEKLDSRSQTILTRVEELQDTVESLRDDVLKRHVTPKAGVTKKLSADVQETAAELASLQEHIKTVKPMWKKTWEEELQNIVEEQQFLSHQEQLLEDLMEDHKAVSEVYGHVSKIISLRGSQHGRVGGGGGGGGYRPTPREEGHGGLSTVLLEIKGAQVDPEKRMKAIEANQRSRAKDIESRSDEFQDELQNFVSGRKLKLTGGAEEVERVRQKRNDATLKAMFNGTTSPPAPASPGV
ncbi:AIP3-domain-containing protein [Auriculariales sp. MPI-PUGE-AT-0066]|nr:AIP3-domain-containing protein [Auriculariales sp. MPI-PUGE-AT-0066]